jgi:hypothetical protein
MLHKEPRTLSHRAALDFTDGDESIEFPLPFGSSVDWDGLLGPFGSFNGAVAIDARFGGSGFSAAFAAAAVTTIGAELPCAAGNFGDGTASFAAAVDGGCDAAFGGWLSGGTGNFIVGDDCCFISLVT